VAAHASNPNAISRFTSHLVQAITPEQAPGYGLRINAVRAASP
jgi:hypothetical protein